MINKILAGITVKLDDVFGFKIYTEDIEQGFTEPCFFVRKINTGTSPLLGDRRKTDFLFDIHFFSPSREQRNEVEIELLENFRMITLSDGDMVHGVNMRTEEDDGVLHCFVNYNVILTSEPKSLDYMEDIEIGEAV